MKRIVFELNNTVQVFSMSTTSNKKIAKDKEKIIQTYTYSIEQYNYILDIVQNGGKADFKTFFSLDFRNCGNCPFSSNQFNTSELKGKCYTHKVFQYSGFVSQLKSIAKQYGNDLPLYSPEHDIILPSWSKDKYIRFGSYGEPTQHPFKLIEAMAKNAKTISGYTHQWANPMFKKYANYLMASTHNLAQNLMASRLGYRSFMATNTNHKEQIHCPTDKVNAKNTTCSKCGLCSGTKGKGTKDIFIFQH